MKVLLTNFQDLTFFTFKISEACHLCRGLPSPPANPQSRKGCGLLFCVTDLKKKEVKKLWLNLLGKINIKRLLDMFYDYVHILDSGFILEMMTIHKILISTLLYKYS